jgi:hypothetical protein
MLSVMVVFIIIDLDSPKRGIIQVNQESLLDTQLALDNKANRHVNSAGQNTNANKKA